MIQKEWFDFILETDSEAVCMLITNAGRSEHHLVTLIDDCMLIQGHSSITHAYCEGNACADFLANEGVAQIASFVPLATPPLGLVRLLHADVWHKFCAFVSLFIFEFFFVFLSFSFLFFVFFFFSFVPKKKEKKERGSL